MFVSVDVDKIIKKARKITASYKHQYMTPEHIWLSLCENNKFRNAFIDCGGSIDYLKDELKKYLKTNIEEVEDADIEDSYYMQKVYGYLVDKIQSSDKNIVEVDHLVSVLFKVPESYTLYILNISNIRENELIYNLCHSEPIFAPTSSVEVEFLDNLNILLQYNNTKLIGRSDIIFKAIQIMNRKTKNNPLFLGEDGVGKTAIIHEIVRRINNGTIDKTLRNATVYSLDLTSLIAGTQYRGELENRIKNTFSQLKNITNPIIYIDNIHSLIGSGTSSNLNVDAVGLLKPYLNDNKIKFIGATTFELYKKHIEKDKNLLNKLKIIRVNEPSIDETITILKGIKPEYEAFHSVRFSNSAVESAVRLTNMYITDRFLPDKAIDILDEAGSYTTLKYPEKKFPTITDKTIEHLVAINCNIPEQTLVKDEKSKLKSLHATLSKSIFGQDEAISTIVNCIKLSRAGLKNPNKPVCNLLFVGPTGVGKTEIAKCLAKTLGIELIRFDMSEYMEKHSSSKLIGSPPGYVGYEEGGLLSDAVKRNPHCVLLLDEIEKANPDIFNMLLQIMDYATITDNQGRKIDFRNVILIMTSNAGASSVGKKLVGFGERKMSTQAIDDTLKKAFTPEFRNRLDSTVTFNGIDDDLAILITKKEVSILKSILKEKNIQLTVPNNVIQFLATKGITKEFGAREIARTVNTELKNLFVDEILFGQFTKGGKCKVLLSDDTLELVKTS
ncbi:MAG: ATP-dependent Clp protease ATP-binding subunit ClpA [Epulopiscium sp. Nuni2H_MBin003]|nr:MAG: ATP-dependent Clp protease ATP-binding subunit ClpA [Epulopiscium sp. Nuni2H_MBin003]